MYLQPDELTLLFHAYPHAGLLHREWLRVRNFPFEQLRLINPNWKTQTTIDAYCVDLRLACLLHFNGDLAAVHRYIGGKHVRAHHDPDVILPCVNHLISTDDVVHLRRILTDGLPASYNASGTNLEFQEFYQYGNHTSIDTRMPQVMVTMNKEDRKEQVLTF